ncbi:MAG: hypothetical protein H0Z29_09235 [Candidatus Marinimicrobia bacterium]|nr:hypothetical protein [Candidatus Neomarinimicrobiota bacterium]
MFNQHKDDKENREKIPKINFKIIDKTVAVKSIRNTDYLLPLLQLIILSGNILGYTNINYLGCALTLFGIWNLIKLINNDKILFYSLLPKKSVKVPVTIKIKNDDESINRKTLVYILNHLKKSELIHNKASKIFHQKSFIHITINFILVVFIFLKIHFKNQDIYGILLSFFLVYNVFSLTVSLVYIKNLSYNADSSLKKFKSELIREAENIENGTINILIIENVSLQPYELLDAIMEIDEIRINKRETVFLSIHQTQSENFILIPNEGYLFNIRYDKRILDIFKNEIELIGSSYEIMDRERLTFNNYYLLKKGYTCFSIFIPFKNFESTARMIISCTNKIKKTVE